MFFTLTILCIVKTKNQSFISCAKDAFKIYLQLIFY